MRHFLSFMLLFCFAAVSDAQIIEYKEEKNHDDLYERIRFMKYTHAISMDVPNGTRSECFYTSETPSGKPIGDHILEIYLFGDKDIGDLYFREYKGTLTEIKEELQESYLGKSLVRYVVDEYDKIIVEFKIGEKLFYQVYGIITLNGIQFQYSSNRGNENYSLERIHTIDEIARSAKI